MSGRPVPAVVEMTSYHLGEKGIATGRFLPSPDDCEAFQTVLNEQSRILKRRMFQCHASQRDVLAQFCCNVEPIRAAPRYDFEVPPHAGRLFYEHFSWCLTGAGWRARVREAARAMGLRRQGELAS
jgi:hypothetical protein